jgi:hypothetical protein
MIDLLSSSTWSVLDVAHFNFRTLPFEGLLKRSNVLLAKPSKKLAHKIICGKKHTITGKSKATGSVTMGTCLDMPTGR